MVRSENENRMFGSQRKHHCLSTAVIIVVWGRCCQIHSYTTASAGWGSLVRTICWCDTLFRLRFTSMEMFFKCACLVKSLITPGNIFVNKIGTRNVNDHKRIGRYFFQFSFQQRFVQRKIDLFPEAKQITVAVIHYQQRSFEITPDDEKQMPIAIPNR